MTSAVEVLRQSLASRHGRRITSEEAEALARIERLVAACKARDAAIEAGRAYNATPAAVAASWYANDEYQAALSDVLGED